MSRPAIETVPGTGPRLHYRNQPGDAIPDDDVLIEIVFGRREDIAPHPRRLVVGLPALHGDGLRESWQGSGPVHCGSDGAIRYSEDATHLFGIIEVDERDHTDIGAAAAVAYAAIVEFQRGAKKPHLLRMWNYFDAITAGSGEEERYKKFCAGRAQGLGVQPAHTLPAATAIGRRDGNSMLQVYWLAANEPGEAVENPRQISAYHYPRQYGRIPPRFARAMLTADGTLLISGTASVVGHATHHDGDLRAQLSETLVNLKTLLQQAHARDLRCPLSFTESTSLKVYLRHPEACALVVDELRRHLPARSTLLVLAADICRDDLLIEIDGMHY